MPNNIGVKPPKFDEDTMQVKLIIPRSLWSKVKEAAASESRSASDQVRLWIAQALKPSQGKKRNKRSGR